MGLFVPLTHGLLFVTHAGITRRLLEILWEQAILVDAGVVQESELYVYTIITQW
jgi:hypothetical protein